MHESKLIRNTYPTLLNSNVLFARVLCVENGAGFPKHLKNMEIHFILQGFASSETASILE